MRGWRRMLSPVPRRRRAQGSLRELTPVGGVSWTCWSSSFPSNDSEDLLPIAASAPSPCRSSRRVGTHLAKRDGNPARNETSVTYGCGPASDFDRLPHHTSVLRGRPYQSINPGARARDVWPD